MPSSPTDQPPAPNSMAPLPPSQFSSREELLQHAKDWAARQGYAIVIARSRFNRLWLKCDRGGVYENRRNLTPEQRKRKRSDSRLLGCPFRMLAVVRKDGVWRVTTENPEHNHSPSEDLSVHPTLRRLTEAQSQKVNEMTEAGNTPGETLEELRKTWPDIKVLTRDIYNARKKYKAQKELTEQAASNVQQNQALETPNGAFPGPTPSGRWEWIPDSDDKSNGSKRRRRKPPTEQQSLDPQLQVPHAHPSLNPRPASAGYPPSRTFQQSMLAPSQQTNTSLARHESAPTRLQHTPTFNSTSSSFDFAQPREEDRSIQFSPQVSANLPQQRPSLQMQPSTASDPTGLMPALAGHMGGFVSHTQNFGGAQLGATAAQQAPFRAQNGQMLLSRIERMEKEQKQQRNMLTQILGAVQMMQAPPR